MRAFRGVADSVDGMGGSLRRVFEIATGFNLANLFDSVVSGALRAGQALVKLGLDTQRQEDAFARVTASLGVNGDALAAQLERASRGLVNVSDVMTSAASSLLEGLDPKQLVTLMEIATSQAKLMGTTTTEAFNRLSDALLTNTERGFKSVRVFLDLNAAHEAHARSLGVTVDRLTDAEKRLATFNELARVSEQRMKTLGEGALTNSQQVERATTAWQNFAETVAKAVVTALQQAAVATYDLTQRLLPHIVAVDNVVKSWARWSLSMMGLRVATPDIDRTIVTAGDMDQALAGAAAGMNSLGTNSAAAAPKIRDTEASIKAAEAAAKAATSAAERAAKVLEQETARALEQNVAGWVKYADAVFDATEESQRAEIAIQDAAVALERTMMAAHTAGWVTYAQAVMDATEAEQQAEVAITNRARAQEEALLRQGDAGWVQYAEAVFAATEAEQMAEVAITDRARAIEESFSTSRLRAIEGWFLSITDTFTKMADGLIAGTLDIGDAFANLGRNLLTNFVQIVLHQVFDPILKAAASFVSDLVGLLGGGASWVEGSTGLLELASDQQSGGGMLSTVSDVASGLSTLYTAVAKMANLPQLSSLIGTGVESLLGSVGLLGPGFTSLSATLSSVVAGIQTGTLSIPAAFGFGPSAASAAASGVSGVSGGVSAASSGGSLFGVSSSALAGGSLIAAPYLALLGAAIGAWFDVEERKFQRRQKDIRDEWFGTQLDTALTAVEQGAPLTADIASFLSVIGKMTEHFGKLRDIEPLILEEDVGQAMRMMRPKTEEEIAGERAWQEGQPGWEFLQQLKTLGIPLMEGEVFPENITFDLDRWTAALRPWVEAVTGAADAMEDVTSATDEVANAEREHQIALAGLRVQATLAAESYGMVADALGVARQAVPDFAALVDEGQIRGAVRALSDGLTEAITDAAVADPSRIATLLNYAGALGALAESGEEAAQTIARVGAAFVTLTDFAGNLRDEADSIRLTQASVLERLRAGLTDVDMAIEGVADRLSTALGASHFQDLNPEAALATAQELRDLTRERYQMEIDAATELDGVVQSFADGVTGIANTVASNAPFLRAIGVDIRGATTSMLQFSRSLPDAGSQITALGGAVNLFLAQLRGVTEGITAGPAPTPAEQPLSAADFEAGIQAILHPPAGSAGDMRSAAEIIEGEIQALRHTIEGPGDVGRVREEIAAMAAKLPDLEAFFARQASLLAGGAGAAAPSGPSAVSQLLDVMPSAEELLNGIREGFSSALSLLDPTERATALNEVFSLLSSGVGQIETLLSQSALSADEQTVVMDQVLAAVGPLGEDIYAALIETAGAQAKAALVAADQLRAIMGPDFSSVQAFIAAKTDAMASALDDLAANITGPLEQAIGAAASAIVAAIPVPPQLQTGADYVRGGVYQLHKGEMVLNPSASEAARGLGITNATLGRSYNVGAAPSGGAVTVALQFGDVHVGGSGREGAREFMDTLRDEIRYGDLGAVIAKRVTGKG